MKQIKYLVLSLCLMAALPASSLAVGLTLSAGAGSSNVQNDAKFRSAFELSPFVEESILRLEVPLELQVAPERAFAVRPGIKLFIPVVGIYGRAGYGFGNIGRSGGLVHSVVLGVGWQLSLINTVGFFLEGTGEPQIKPSGGGTTIMFRAGLMLNL